MANPGQESGVVIGEGVDIDFDNDGVVDVPGFVAMGKSDDGKAKAIELTGQGGGHLKTYDQNTHLLEEILVELKINNEYLSQITETKVTESDVEIK